MAEVLANVLPDGLIEHIADFIGDGLDWDYVYGTTTIYETQHIVTYGGGPEGGFVFFFREREPGWYSWERDWFQEPTYKKLNGILVQKFTEDGAEYVAVAPRDFETEDEDVYVLDIDSMIEFRTHGD